MSDQDRQRAEPEKGQEGSLFGKLPSARPGVRSPRRRAEGTKAASASPGVRRTDAPGRSSASSPPTQPPDPAERPASPPPPTQPAAAEEPEASGRRDAPGVEDLAWAGVTVAAEAATLGVRILSRAIEAVRKPADHR